MLKIQTYNFNEITFVLRENWPRDQTKPPKLAQAVHSIGANRRFVVEECAATEGAAANGGVA